MKDSDWIFIGIDGEMSSSELSQGGQLIQVGAAIWSDQPGETFETFSSLIFFNESAQWSDVAAAVHKIPRADLAQAPSSENVDKLFYDWLLAHGAQEGQRIVVPIGFNVAAFDMPFFRSALPLSSSLIARRAIDLNAICFTYADWDPNPSNGTRDFAGWKRSMKIAANNWLAHQNVTIHEHDAQYDALQALVGWWWLRTQITTMTIQLNELNTQLNASNPLRSILGDGLLGRLNMVSDKDIMAIIQSLPTDVSPRKWFGTKQEALNGSTPLAAITDGRILEVLNLNNNCNECNGKKFVPTSFAFGAYGYSYCKTCSNPDAKSNYINLEGDKQ